MERIAILHELHDEQDVDTVRDHVRRHRRPEGITHRVVLGQHVVVGVVVEVVTGVVEVERAAEGAVALCSYTTIVGYGSLLLSQNKGVNSFGEAAMLGELTCLVVAILLAPALLGLTAPRAIKPATPAA